MEQDKTFSYKAKKKLVKKKKKNNKTDREGGYDGIVIDNISGSDDN